MAVLMLPPPSAHQSSFSTPSALTIHRSGAAEMPGTGPTPGPGPEGNVDSPSMSATVRPASSIAARDASMASAPMGRSRRRPTFEWPTPTMATLFAALNGISVSSGQAPHGHDCLAAVFVVHDEREVDGQVVEGALLDA